MTDMITSEPATGAASDSLEDLKLRVREAKGKFAWTHTSSEAFYARRAEEAEREDPSGELSSS